jgi:hypothetical protein
VYWGLQWRSTWKYPVRTWEEEACEDEAWRGQWRGGKRSMRTRSEGVSEDKVGRGQWGRGEKGSVRTRWEEPCLVLWRARRQDTLVPALPVSPSLCYHLCSKPKPLILSPCKQWVLTCFILIYSSCWLNTSISGTVYVEQHHAIRDRAGLAMQGILVWMTDVPCWVKTTWLGAGFCHPGVRCHV